MDILCQLTQINLFQRRTTKGSWEWDTGTFVGRPFRLSYVAAEVLVSDAWKQRAKGIPQGAFLLAYYDSEVEKDGHSTLSKINWTF